MLKKILLTIQAAAVVAAISITSCAIPNAQSEAKAENQTLIEKAMIEKNGESRLGNWELIDSSINNARDIGAYKDVYVISQDGRTIYKKAEGSDTFYPMHFSYDELDENQVWDLGVGGTKTLGPDREFKGVIATSGNDIYAMIQDGRSLNLEFLSGAGYKASIVDVAVSVEGDIYMCVSKSTGNHIKKYDWATSTWSYLISAGLNEVVIAIDVNEDHRYGYYPQYGLTILTAKNSVYDIERDPYSGNKYHEINKSTIIPSVDIAADHRLGTHHESFATFHNNTSVCYYVNRQAGTAISLGAARRISIGQDGYLWDAYDGGIWRRRID